MRRQFSLADIAYAPGMERLAANLPVMRGFNLRNNPDYPETGAWFGALDARPAYQRVKSDDTTHNLVFRSAHACVRACSVVSCNRMCTVCAIMQACAGKG